MIPTHFLVGIPLFFLGIAGLYIVNRRRFRRRNHAGVQIFQSYGQMISLRFAEGLLSLASWALCGGGGFVIIQGYLAQVR